MKKFLVTYSQKKGRLEPHLLEERVHFLRTLSEMGALIICGLLEKDRAVLIISSLDKEIAKGLIEQDPFLREGYYQHFTLDELIEANEENNWLLD